MQVPPEEERFAKNAVIMAEAIYMGMKKLNDEGHTDVNLPFIQLAIAMIKDFDRHDLIQGFIKNGHDQCWDKIKARDETFFVDNVTSIFAPLPMNMVIIFKDLFIAVDKQGKPIVSHDLKQSIWQLFDAMIKIAIKYIHKQRKTDISFFKEVQLHQHAATWQVQLL